jgi:hypothetical protein
MASDEICIPKKPTIPWIEKPNPRKKNDKARRNNVGLVVSL